MRRFRPVLLVGLLSLLLLAGCGSYEAQVTAPGGADGLAGDIAIRDARINRVPPQPGATAFPVGGNAELTFTAANTGDATDRLLGIASPVAGGTALGGDTEIPAGFSLASGYITTPLRGVVRTDIRLTGLREELRPGLTYPVTFVFERGGSVTLQLPAEIPTPDTTPSAAPAN